MKKEKLLSAFGEIDDKYVAEARPKGQRTILLQGLAIAASLVITVGVVLILTLTGGKNNYVYEVDPDFLSAVQDYINNAESGDLVGATTPPPDDSTGPEFPGEGSGADGSYVEITDNQVDGIIEGDFCKTTNKYIFRLGGHSVYIYSINEVASKLVSEYVIPYIKGEGTFTAFDMFLSDNGRTLTLFGKYDNNDNEASIYTRRTVVMSIDVSNVFTPKEISRIVINGDKNAVRKIGNKFYLITDWAFSRNKIDYDDPKSFIPSIDYGSSLHICDSSKIVYPEKISSVSYRYVTVLNEGDLSVKDEAALMLSGDVYFTKNNIVFDRAYTKGESENGINANRCYTKIGVLSFDDGLDFKGYITVKGWTLNQYSYDERDGALRIVTSLSDRAGYTVRYDSASLYVYDVSSLEEIASVESFAPYGEGVTAVRFEGDKLYVCTADIASYTDPVYFFDLSDYESITYADTGFIDGFSSSLIDFGEGYLLGVGLEDRNNYKLEIYKRDGSAVVSVDKRLIVGTLCTDYKSFLIDRENNIFGISKINGKFLIFKIEDGNITPLKEFGEGSQYSRAFSRDGHIYLTLPTDMYVLSDETDYIRESKNAHTQGEWTLVKEPSCGERGILERVCSCGRVSTKSDYSSYTEHKIVDGICENCGKDLGSVKKNADLIIYTSNGDGTCTVTGTKTTLLGNVVIPERSPKGELVTKIGDYAFSMSGITRITLPNSVKSIGAYALYMSSISSINLGSVERIEKYAFTGCPYLDGITLSSSLKYIGKEAFSYCESLNEIVIPDSVGEIGIGAFENCSNLEKVKLPANLTVINVGVFNQCRALREIIIPSGVTKIDGYAFNYCQSLTSVIIPDGVTELGNRAFGACSKLMHVTLGSGVKTLGEDAFKDCVTLVDVINKSNLDIQAGSEDHGMIGYYASSISKDESSLVTVGDYVFFVSDKENVLVAYNGNDTVLHLPEIEGGYRIASRLFYKRSDLTEIHIPDSVSAIGDEAFNGCTGIDSITLPSSVKTIGEKAFINCNFTSFNMGDGVVSVGYWALRSCWRLKELHLSESLEYIGEGAFSDCQDLVSVELPQSLKYIGAEAFYSCLSVTEFIIPEGITVIERDAFRNCSSLVSIIIPESVVEIKDAFYICRALKTVYYRGSEEQWKNIAIEHNNGLFSKVDIIYNYSK